MSTNNIDHHRHGTKDAAIARLEARIEALRAIPDDIREGGKQALWDAEEALEYARRMIEC